MAFVLDKNKKPLAPCHETRARILVSRKKAAIYLYQPFTIILDHEISEDGRPLRLKIDPGSQHTGLAILDENRVIWFGQIEHRKDIGEKLKNVPGIVAAGDSGKTGIARHGLTTAENRRTGFHSVASAVWIISITGYESSVHWRPLVIFPVRL